ncbi:MAG: TSUP family transporter [Candidatus Magnetomorum sp.]|nr:TSUP family transporter [Candidatus Magnetomorum sp.]
MKKAFINILILLIFAAHADAALPDQRLQLLQESINQAVATVRVSIVSVKAMKKQASTGVWFESMGSGFVIDERGYILTNYHVIENASQITVKLWRASNNNFTASVFDSDKSLDLAVLRVDSNERFIPATVADSDMLEVGDWIISVGSPFGFNHSVTLGIISNLHQDITIGDTIYKNMIQTDAVINQGNSGGPVVDITGRVIGVGTAIYAPKGTYSGLGFAIPINRAKHFYSRVSGAIPAAAVQPAKKVPVNLNKKMPNDAIHKDFSDCTKCHIITQKMVANVQKKMPHPAISGCEKCHIMINEPVAGGPVAVALTMPISPPTPINGQESFANLFKHVLLKLVLLILVSSIIFTMLGVGGGFLYVPILLSCGIDFHTAATTSLIMITTAQISALYNFFKSGLVDLKLVWELEIPTMLGAFAGGMLAHHFNVSALSVMFAFTMFLASYSMMRDDIREGASLLSGRSSAWEFHHRFGGYEYRVDMILAIPLTFFVGYMSGMLGLAGGWLKIPIMVVLFGIPMKIAVATSSLMVPITAFSGFLGHSIAGHFDFRLALSLSLITIIGAQIGSRLSIDVDSHLLRFLFALVLSIVGLWMLLRVL